MIIMPQGLTRERYVSIYSAKLRGSNPPPSSRRDDASERGAYAPDTAEAECIANKSFDTYAGLGNAHIPETKIKKDLEELTAGSETVERFATKKVAHLDEKPPTALPTFDELDACVTLLEKLVLKYEMILKTSAPQSLLPTWQYDWKAIFYEPWIAKP
jgi:hypothetical protein